MHGSRKIKTNFRDESSRRFGMGVGSRHYPFPLLLNIKKACKPMVTKMR